MPKATTSLKLDDDLKERVRQLAEARRRSPHWVMREAIAEYVERESKRQSFHDEAIASWKAYQETGRHLTGDEVFEWLDRWGEADESAIGECHG